MKFPKFDIRYPLMISACLLAACGGLLMFDGWSSPGAPKGSPPRGLTDYSEAALQRQLASFDPAMAALAQRFAPLGVGRAVAATPKSNPEPTPDQFASDDLAPMTAAEAFRLNASVPISKAANPPARPFVLEAAPESAARALDCLTATVYYEAAYESASGQAAVAQVVLNRMRHPAYPKSICGVVLQGADRRTGCQFTFTCDGALSRPPDPAAWTRARAVAQAALGGHVEKKVGNATHYHTVWVRPYWAPSLTKVQVIGAHIFYRWTGGWGLAPAFRGQYAGEASDYASLRTLYAALQPLRSRAPLAVGGSADASPRLVSLVDTTVAPAPEAIKLAEVLPVALPPPPKFVSISGEVIKPGSYPWREGMTLQDAAKAAGGFTNSAKTSEVFIRRPGDAAATKIQTRSLILGPDDEVRVPVRYF